MKSANESMIVDNNWSKAIRISDSEPGLRWDKKLINRSQAFNLEQADWFVGNAPKPFLKIRFTTHAQSKSCKTICCTDLKIVSIQQQVTCLKFVLFANERNLLSHYWIRLLFSNLNRNTTSSGPLPNHSLNSSVAISSANLALIELRSDQLKFSQTKKAKRNQDGRSTRATFGENEAKRTKRVRCEVGWSAEHAIQEDPRLPQSGRPHQGEGRLTQVVRDCRQFKTEL